MGLELRGRIDGVGLWVSQSCAAELAAAQGERARAEGRVIARPQDAGEEGRGSGEGVGAGQRDRAGRALRGPRAKPRAVQGRHAGPRAGPAHPVLLDRPCR